MLTARVAKFTPALSRGVLRRAASSKTSGNFFSVEPRGEVAVVRLDDRSGKVNTLNQDMMAEFDSMLDAIDKDDAVKSVVLISGKKDSFIAGADISMLDKAKSEEEAVELARGGQRIMDRIERSAKPFVAAINGSCLGGGLEVALACKYRIASTSPKTKLGLPEVQLGLLPGAGGTQRLPRSVGIQESLMMITTGKQLDAAKAKKRGLVHQTADPNALEDAALQAAKGLADGSVKASAKKKSIVGRLLEDNPAGRAVLFNQARQQGEKKSGGNYPAIPAIFDAVEASVAGGRAGYDKEAELFGKLVMTPESAALRSIFFGMTALKKNRFGKPARRAETLGVLGAGLMGAGIAEVSAHKAGMRVLLKDRDTKGLARGEKQVKDNMNGRVKRRALSPFERDQILSRVVGLTDEDASWARHFGRADMVIEAVFEDLDLKHRVIRDIEHHLPEHCIFASNTSALPIADIAKASKRPERVVGMHYFSPVDKMPLLEVIKHAGTDDDVAASVVDVGLRQGKTVIVVKDVPGFYVNRCLGPYMAECAALLQDGADPERLDKIMKKFGFPVGPITLTDEVGVDVAAHVADFLGKNLGDRMLGPDGRMFEDMVAAGMLGRKTGSGFFTYASGKKRARQLNPEAIKIVDKYRAGRGQAAKQLGDDELRDRMVARFVNEAALCLQDDIIENPVDGDIGAVFGIGFPPFRGGPFRMVDAMGAGKLVDQMLGFADKYGPQFAPAPILQDMAKSASKFHA